MTPHQNTQSDGATDVEQRLVAFVVADSKNDCLKPLAYSYTDSETDNICAPLLPLLGVPVLHYVIQFLIRNCVKKIYVLTTNNTVLLEEAVKEYDTRYKNYHADTFEVGLMKLNGSKLSPVDFLREAHQTLLDNNEVIPRHFILMPGDVYAIGNIQPIIKAHVENAETYSDMIMTKVFMQSYPTHRLEDDVEDDFVLCYAAKSHQLLDYASMKTQSEWRLKNKTIKDLGVALENLRVRYDATDIEVSICTENVFKEIDISNNYSSFDKTFIEDMLTCETQTKHVFIGFMQSPEGMVCGQNEPTSMRTLADNRTYAVKIKDSRTLHKACCDIIERWTYPVGPNCDIVPRSSYMPYKGRSIFFGRHVQWDVGADAGPLVVVGDNTTIDKGTQISHSVIGKNCRIGHAVSITQSILMDDVTVGDNAIITNSIVMRGTTVNTGQKIPNIIIHKQGQIDEASLSQSRVIGSNSAKNPWPCPPESFLSADEAESESEDGSVEDEPNEDGLTEEVSEWIIEGFRDPDNMENKIFEINSYRIQQRLNSIVVIPAIVCTTLRFLCSQPGFHDELTKLKKAAEWAAFLTKHKAVALFEGLASKENEENNVAIFQSVLDFCRKLEVQNLERTNIENPLNKVKDSFLWIMCLLCSNGLDVLNESLLPDWRIKQIESDPTTEEFLSVPKMEEFLEVCVEEDSDED